MISYQNPTAIRHQGQGVLIAERTHFEPFSNVTKRDWVYNILAFNSDTIDDSLGWQGFHSLPEEAERETSVSGISVLRVLDVDESMGSAQIASDQKHIYFFRPNGHTLSVERFLLVEGADESARDGRGYSLVPDWEVCFRRSGSPDLPASPNDISAYQNPDGKPFLDPRRYLSLSPGDEFMDLSLGFQALLLPSGESGTLQWRIFARNETGKKILAYSVNRLEDGWFDLGSTPTDESGRVLPVADYSATVEVESKEENLLFTGYPAASLYQRLEPMITGSGEAAQMRTANRILLACPAEVETAETDVESEARLLTFDFEVDHSGGVAFDGAGVSRIPCGETGPEALSVDFPLPCEAAVANAISSPERITVQAWLYPQQGPVSADTASEKRLILFQGDASSPEEGGLELSIVDQFRIRITIGTGESIFVAETSENVLTYASWSNITTTYDGSQFQVFMNGALVAVTHTGSPGLPRGTINSIGSTQGGFVGQMTEVRIWSKVLTEIEIRDNIISKLPDPPSQEGLLAYWPMDGGTGVAIDDVTKNGYDATMNGCVWSDGTAPIARPLQPISHIDSENRSLNAGWLKPTTDYPNFGPVVRDSRPCLLATGDGPVHLYYAAANSMRFTVARLSGTATRAYFAGKWSAMDGETEIETGSLTFISRQTGAYNNFHSISITAADPDLTANIVLEGRSVGSGFREEKIREFGREVVSTIETWNGVPRRLGWFDQILNGQAVCDPSDNRILDGSSIFYDFSGRKNQVLISLSSDPGVASGLRFVSTTSTPIDPTEKVFTLNRVIASVENGEVAIALHINTPLDSLLIAKFGKIPANPDAVIRLLSGGGTDDVYAENTESAPAWALPAASENLFIVAPKIVDSVFVVANAKFLMTAAGDPEKATFTALLILQDGVEVEAKWEGVSRKTNQFIDELYKNATPEQDSVLNYISFLDRTEGLLLDAEMVEVTEQCNLRYVTALVAAFREGNGGALTASFDEPAQFIQGVEGIAVESDCIVSSNLIFVQPLQLPQRGYPARASLGATPSQIVLAAPGRSGGWLRDAPRYAESFDATGALSVALDELVPSPDVYDEPGAMTIESWLLPDSTGSVAEDGEETLQSVLHYSAAEEGIAYGLALNPVDTPRFFAKVKFSISDAVAVDVLEDRLVSNDEYTVQLYIRPSLISPGEPELFWIREDTQNPAGPRESMSIKVIPNEGGGRPSKWQLVFQSGESVTMETSPDLSGVSWSMVTLVRGVDSVEIYINGENSISRSDVPAVPMAVNQFTTSNSPSNQRYEFDLNEYSCWNRKLSAQEVSEGYLSPLSGSETGLVVLFPLSRSEPDYCLTNRCRWTTIIYNSAFSGSPYFTRTGIFFDLIGTFGETAGISVTPAVSPSQWHHAAVVLDRRGAYTPQGGEYGQSSGSHDTELGSEFSIDARIRINQSDGSRQVVSSRFGDDLSDQIFELGVSKDGIAYITVRLKAVAGGSLGDANNGLRTLYGPSRTRVNSDSPHHIAASIGLVSLKDQRTNRDVIALSGEVYVDGEGTNNSFIPPSSNLASYRKVTVIGGSGSGYYEEGKTVTISADDPTFFQGWSGTALIAEPSNPSTQFTIGVGESFIDVTIAANAFLDPVEFAAGSIPIRVGASGKGLNVSGAFNGQISDLRQWAKQLTSIEIKEISAQPGATPFDSKLISWWQFSEQQGRLAKDLISDNDLTLTTSTDWAWFDGAQVSFYVDGEPVPSMGMTRPPSSRTPRQMRIGGLQRVADAPLSAGFRGMLDELRLWKGSRTREQIVNNSSRYLTGAEKNILGYWRFDTGSGNTVGDRTIHRGDALYSNLDGTPGTIAWALSSAPIGFDAGIVDDALDTRENPQAVELSATPTATAVFEYADTSTLSDGSVRSLLKRSYVYEGTSGVDDDTGYMVGELERIYVGQVQTDPSVLGYIEGAPPLPSENLTRPLTEASDVDTYVGISSVTLTDNSSCEASFGSGSERTRKLEFNFSVGGAGGTEKEEVIGIPPYQTAIQSTKFELKLGGSVKGSFEWSDDGEAELTAATERGVTHSMGNGGKWESKQPDGNYFLESGERRFIPANVGSAIVSSRVADLYALRLPSSGALVSLFAEPNVDIPADINIIRFPINPEYQLAGSLDGNIGLQKAPLTELSYYKPREAYTLKRRVESQRKAVEAYYQQASLDNQLGRGVDLSAIAAANPLFTPDLEAPVRDMVNTYVWAAGGGTYSESEGFSTELTETYSLGRSAEIGGGFNFSLFFLLFGVGINIEGELSGSVANSFSATKSFKRGRALSLEVEASPDSFPYRYDEDGEMVEEVVPGKVDGYRFMTFFLSNNKEYASTLFDEVIDPHWLRTSRDPNAAALRESQAMVGSLAPWRILHRVTYVSRIPPRFQALPSLSDEVGVPEAPNQLQNAVFLELVRAKIPSSGASAAEVSAAVVTVLHDDVKIMIPWWEGFLAKATVENSPAQERLGEITIDAIEYAISVIGVAT